MIQKTLIALAVSAAVTAPAAQAAEFQVDENTTINVGGTVEPVYQSVNDSNGDSESEFADNDSTFQIDGEHMWNENTTGFFHIEYEWDTDEEGGNGVDSLDSAWIGMKGDLGMIRAGTSDTLYEDNIAELVDDFENGPLTEEADGGEGDQIRYVSPSFGGFSIGAEARIRGDGEDVIEQTNGDDFGDGATGLSFVARYDASNWGVVAGVDDRGATAVDTDNSGQTDQYNDESTSGVGGYFEISNFRLAARYTSESNEGNDNDVEYTGTMGSYDYGNGIVHIGVQDVSPDQGDSFTEFAGIVRHDLYDNLELFAAVAQYDRPNDAGDLTEVGAIYSF